MFLNEHIFKDIYIIYVLFLLDIHYYFFGGGGVVVLAIKKIKRILFLLH